MRCDANGTVAQNVNIRKQEMAQRCVAETNKQRAQLRLVRLASRGNVCVIVRVGARRRWGRSCVLRACMCTCLSECMRACVLSACEYACMHAWLGA
eukprot:48416-Pleurochrysis_carterae.AAC.1